MSRDEKSSYYDAGGIETLDVIKAKLTPEQYEGYLLGNIIKYATRLNFKGSAERDAAKLANYSRWFAEAGVTPNPWQEQAGQMAVRAEQLEDVLEKAERERDEAKQRLSRALSRLYQLDNAARDEARGE